MRLNAKFCLNGMELKAQFKNLQKVTVTGDVDPYEGEYVITPKVESQTMPTAQKYMTQDVQIKGIPIFETSNNSGGKTVYIGSEVEIYGS